MRKLYPKTRVRINYAVGAGLYATVGDGMKLAQQDIDRIKKNHARKSSTRILRWKRKRVDIDDAIDFFSADGQEDKVRLLRYRQFLLF